MNILNNCSLLAYNTFGIDAHADFLIEYNSVDELKQVIQSDIFKSNKYLHVGSGSNLLFLSDYKGLILHSQIKDIKLISENDEHVFIEVGAGVVWDDFVAFAVDKGWGGVENLSLIPGEIGASAVQNIGAYGVEVQDVIEQVNTIHIASLEIQGFTNAACKYAYRESVFKNELKNQYIVTSVVFKLDLKPKFKLNYQHLEEEVLKQGTLDLKHIRKTIIAIREAKLPDTKVLGNAGSFFMNPVIKKQLFNNLHNLYPEMPHYYVSDSKEKVPAAWLIDQCGWKGKQLGKAAVHDKQALVLVNKGGATGADIVYLAEQIQQSVKAQFGIDLQPEVNYI